MQILKNVMHCASALQHECDIYAKLQTTYIYIYLYTYIGRDDVLRTLFKNTSILSGRIGKVVGSHAAIARSIPAEVALIYTMHEALRGYCP